MFWKANSLQGNLVSLWSQYSGSPERWSVAGRRRQNNSNYPTQAKRGLGWGTQKSIIRLNEFQELFVDAGVVGKFGMEGGGHDVSLPDEDGVAFALGEDFDA